MTAGVFPRGGVVISGAAGGLGTAVARALAGDGVPLLLVDREPPEAIAHELSARGVSCAAVLADMRDAVGLTDVVGRGRRELGPLCHLVHCAAVLRMAPVADLSVEEFRDVLDVNVVGAFVLARAVAEGCDEGGSIVLISSTGGIVTSAQTLAYGVSKQAVRGVMQGLAQEYGAQKIRVNAVAPGTMDTPLFGREIAQDWVERSNGLDVKAKLETDRAESFLDELPEPGAVAELCRFLLGPAARSITGQMYTAWGVPMGAG